MTAVHRCLDVVWSFLAAAEATRPAEATLEIHAERTVRLLYACCAALLIPHGADAVAIAAEGAPYPLWPIRLFDFLAPTTWVPVIWGGLPLALLACALWPRARALRIGAAALMLLWVAARASQGKVDHGEHGWLFVLGTLAFAGPSSRRGGWHGSFVLAQALVGLTYAMSAFWKLGAASFQLLVRGEVGYFHPDAMAMQVAERVIQSGREPWLSDVVIELPLLGFGLAWAAIYIEAGALFAAFRPSLHRLWGVALISLHLGIEAVMGIPFGRQAVLVAVLFVASPSAETHPGGPWLRALPLVALTRKLLQAWRARSGRAED